MNCGIHKFMFDISSIRPQLDGLFTFAFDQNPKCVKTNAHSNGCQTRSTKGSTTQYATRYNSTSYIRGYSSTGITQAIAISTSTSNPAANNFVRTSKKTSYSTVRNVKSSANSKSLSIANLSSTTAWNFLQNKGKSTTNPQQLSTLTYQGTQEMTLNATLNVTTKKACQCNKDACAVKYSTQNPVNVSSEDHRHKIKTIKASLLVRRKNLTMHKRKQGCAADTRASSMAIGCVGGCVIGVVIIVIIMSDIAQLLGKVTKVNRLPSEY